MLFAEEVDDKEFLTGLFNAIYDELPAGNKTSIKIQPKKQEANEYGTPKCIRYEIFGNLPAPCSKGRKERAHKGRGR